MALKPKTIIVAGSAIQNYGWLAAEIAPEDFIICADSGLRHVHKIGITPDIIIGDFDSVDRDLLTTYQGKSEVIHDTDQNSTDLMKALDYINKLPSPQKLNDTDPRFYGGDDDIVVYAAVGERADHDFSNYLILLNRTNCNDIILKTERDERRVITKPLTFQATIGDMVGVFPLLPVGTLSYKGLQYPAEGLGGPYELGWNGSCNPVINERVEIHIDQGAALVTRSYISLGENGGPGRT